MAAPHMAALRVRRAALAMALLSAAQVRYAGAVRRHRVVAGLPASGNALSFCGGVSRQCSPQRQALWAPALWLLHCRATEIAEVSTDR